MKVFAMNDCDWVAAPDLESAILFYMKQVAGTDTPGDREEFMDEPHEVSEEAMGRLQFSDEDGTKRTFREQLALLEAAAGASFPQFFASTEY